MSSILTTDLLTKKSDEQLLRAFEELKSSPRIVDAYSELEWFQLEISARILRRLNALSNEYDRRHSSDWENVARYKAWEESEKQKQNENKSPLFGNCDLGPAGL